MNISELLINEDDTVLYAMERLDKIAKKVLFLHEDGKLLAALTDGDIRRWILKRGSLDAKVREMANYDPKFLIGATRKEALRYMKKNLIEALPILDNKHTIINVITWDDTEISAKKEQIALPVVMMAGGLGKRLYPYTNILPKPLIPVGEIPIAEHIIRQFESYGCDQFFLIVNHKKNMIKAYFNEVEKSYAIHYADEDKPLGTGGGLSLLKGKITSTFILTNCDILIQEDFSKIYKFHKEKGNMITMICSLKNFSIPYGVVEIGEEGDIAEMKEKPQISFFTNTGCYFVEPQVIEELEENVSVGFPDIIEKYKQRGEKVAVYPIGENAWLDMGQMDEMERMKERLGIGD